MASKRFTKSEVTKMKLHHLKGNEAFGLRGKRGQVVAKVKGVWYDSITVAVKHNQRGGDTIVEAVDLKKPLTPGQIKGIWEVL